MACQETQFRYPLGNCIVGTVVECYELLHCPLFIPVPPYFSTLTHPVLANSQPPPSQPPPPPLPPPAPDLAVTLLPRHRNMVKSAGVESISEEAESEQSDTYSLTEALQRAGKRPTTAGQKLKTPQRGRKPPLKEQRPVTKPPTVSKQSRYSLRSLGQSNYTSESQQGAVESESDGGSQSVERLREDSQSQQAGEGGVEEELSLWEWAEWTLKSLTNYFSLRPL